MPSAAFEPAIPAIKRLQGLHLRLLGHLDRPRHGLLTRSGETTLVLRIVHRRVVTTSPETISTLLLFKKRCSKYLMFSVWV